ncbi:MAG: hypothetical protein ACO24O_07190 [Arenimonas sp.]
MTTVPIFEHDNRMNLIRDWTHENLRVGAQACTEAMLARIAGGDPMGAGIHARLLFRMLREIERRELVGRMSRIADLLRAA